MTLTAEQKAYLDKLNAGNRLRPEVLLQEAERKSNPFHTRVYALNDSEAVKQHRLDVCRRIIGDYKFTVQLSRRDMGSKTYKVFGVSVRKYRPLRTGSGDYADVHIIARDMNSLLTSTLPTLRQVRMMLFNLINQYRISQCEDHLDAVRHLEAALAEIDQGIAELELVPSKRGAFVE